MKKTFVPLLLIALLFGTAAKGEANLIQNGSFESPALAANTWQQLSSIGDDNWYLSPGSPNFEIGWGSSVYGVTGYEGNQVLELDSTASSTINQDVVLQAGTYTLSFLSGRRTTSMPDVNSPAYLATQQFGVSFGNDLLGTLVLPTLLTPTSSNMAFSPHLFNLVVTVPGTYTLSFWGAGTPNDSVGALLDDVRVDRVPDGGVTATLLGLALAGVGLVRRRMNS